jgi:hypothetical protein
MKRKYYSLLAIIIGTAMLFFILAMLAISYIMISHGDPTTGIINIFVQYHIEFMVLLGILGVGIGGMSYYNFITQEKSIEKTQEFTKHIILRFIDSEEQVIIKRILSSKEAITQAQISRLKHMGKVKAHRTVQKLEEKQLIQTTPYGKTKQLRLHPEIQQLFDKK